MKPIRLTAFFYYEDGAMDMITKVSERMITQNIDISNLPHIKKQCIEKKRIATPDMLPHRIQLSMTPNINIKTATNNLIPYNNGHQSTEFSAFDQRGFSDKIKEIRNCGTNLGYYATYYNPFGNCNTMPNDFTIICHSTEISNTCHATLYDIQTSLACNSNATTFCSEKDMILSQIQPNMIPYLSRCKTPYGMNMHCDNGHESDC